MLERDVLCDKVEVMRVGQKECKCLVTVVDGAKHLQPDIKCFGFDRIAKQDFC